MRGSASLLLGLVLLGPARLGADVVVMRDGDRFTGKTLIRGTRFLNLQTPYGRLRIPLDKIERIVKEDGTEEVLNPPAGAVASVGPAPRSKPLRLFLAITGKTFWQAWHPKGPPPPDPTLRLEVRLDEKAIAAYADGLVDEDEIPDAIVNSFSFAPDAVKLLPSPGVQLLAPEVRPGRVLLEIVAPPESTGRHRLRLAYQTNEGTRAEPAWRDLVETTTDVELSPESPTIVQVEQDRGRMEYGKRKMRNVETFRVVAKVE